MKVDIKFAGLSFVALTPKAIAYIGDLKVVSNVWEGLELIKDLVEQGFEIEEFKPTKEEVDKMYKELS